MTDLSTSTFLGNKGIKGAPNDACDVLQQPNGHPTLADALRRLESNEVAQKRQCRSPCRPTLADEAFGGILGGFVQRLAPTTEADPAAILLQAYCAAGVVIGTGPRLRLGTEIHRLNENVLVVGRSADARKGTSLSPVLALFKGIASERWELVSGLSSGEGLIASVEHFQVPLLVRESEFSSVLARGRRDGNTLSEVVRQCWDGPSLQIITKNNPIRTDRAFVSIVGHITMHALRTELTSKERNNGFANRFLFCYAERARLVPLPPDQTDILLHYAEALRGRIEKARAVESISLSEAATRCYEKMYLEIEGNRPDGLLASLTSRGPQHILRLAAIDTLLESTSSQIEPENLLRARTLWNYSFDSVRHVFGAAREEKIDDEILEELRNEPDGMSRTEIRNTWRSRNHADALDRLLEAGLIREQKVETGKRGRPARFYHAVGGRDE